jgi:hypothetical protein
MCYMQTTEDRAAVRRARKDTAIVDGTTLTHFQPAFERWLAYALLALSFFGAVLAFNRGQLWPIAPWAAAAGIALQLPVTAVQWMYNPRRSGLNIPYGIAFLFGAASSVFGFGPILLPHLTTAYAGIIELRAPVALFGAPGYTVAAGITLVALAAVLEATPEAILVD